MCHGRPSHVIDDEWIAEKLGDDNFPEDPAVGRDQTKVAQMLRLDVCHSNE